MFFFIRMLVDCIYFSDIDSEYENTPGQKAYPAALMLRLIVLGMIYSIHSNCKLEAIIRENVVFMYTTGFETPSFSTIAVFKHNLNI